MTKGLDEGKLRELFQRIKRGDERRTPLFSSTLGRAYEREKVHRRIRPFVPIAAGAATLIVVVGVLILSKVSDSPTTPESLASITRWKSPTEFLLRSSSEELLKTVPQFTKASTLNKPIIY